jgi:hypothetical protein
MDLLTMAFEQMALAHAVLCVPTEQLPAEVGGCTEEKGKRLLLAEFHSRMALKLMDGLRAVHALAEARLASRRQSQPAANEQEAPRPFGFAAGIPRNGQPERA